MATAQSRTECAPVVEERLVLHGLADEDAERGEHADAAVRELRLPVPLHLVRRRVLQTNSETCSFERFVSCWQIIWRIRRRFTANANNTSLCDKMHPGSATRATQQGARIALWTEARQVRACASCRGSKYPVGARIPGSVLASAPPEAQVSPKNDHPALAGVELRLHTTSNIVDMVAYTWSQSARGDSRAALTKLARQAAEPPMHDLRLAERGHRSGDMPRPRSRRKQWTCDIVQWRR